MEPGKKETIQEIKTEVQEGNCNIEEVKLTGDIMQSLRYDYVPLIQINIQNYADELRNAYISIKKDDYVEPPFIAEIFGKEREKILTKLKNEIAKFSRSQQNYYKAQFFEAERKLAEEFEAFYGVKDKYHKYIILKNKLKVSAYHMKNDLDLTQTDGKMKVNFFQFRS